MGQLYFYFCIVCVKNDSIVHVAFCTVCSPLCFELEQGVAWDLEL